MWLRLLWGNLQFGVFAGWFIWFALIIFYCPGDVLLSACFTVILFLCRLGVFDLVVINWILFGLAGSGCFGVLRFWFGSLGHVLSRPHLLGSVVISLTEQPGPQRLSHQFGLA